MSYEQNLGRVKGDAGTTYIPVITKENGKLYISYTSNDGTPIPAELAKRELSSYVYKPLINSNTKEISFILTDTSLLTERDEVLNFGSIKGDTGNSTIGTKIVTEKPEYESLPQNEKQLIAEGKSLIYVIDNDETYLDTGVFEKKGDNVKFVYFENKLRFDNYYTINQTYAQWEIYNKGEIDARIGNITEQQNAILRMLGDSDSIIILDDE